MTPYPVMPLVGWRPPICKCSHPSLRHHLTLTQDQPDRCLVDGCGCREFRPKPEENTDDR